MQEDIDKDPASSPAGHFSSWITGIKEAIVAGRASDVPCNGCTACCTSSQFIHIDPDEADTLAHIPSKLLFPAPLLPKGHVLLGYDERGRCPMFVDSQCSIYQHRPRTCRAYDCRVFPAAGLVAEIDKPLIARQARRWQFSFPSESDLVRHAALKLAAAFIHENPEPSPTGIAPRNATQLAVLALLIHEAFLRTDAETGRLTLHDPAPDAVRAEIVRQTDYRLALRAPSPPEQMDSP